MEISLDQLREIVVERKGATFVEIVTNTEPKMRKTGNPYYGRVRRIARRNGMLGTSYENDVNNQRHRENQPLDDEGQVEPFVAEALWKGKGQHVGPNLARHTETGEEYLVFFPARRDAQGNPIADEDQWLIDGNPVPKETIEPYLVAGNSEKQQVTRKIPWRTIGLSNVRQIKIDGNLHVVA